MGFLVWRGFRQIQGTMDSVSWMMNDYHQIKSENQIDYIERIKTKRLKDNFGEANPIEVGEFNKIISANSLSDFELNEEEKIAKRELRFGELYDKYQKQIFPEYHDVMLKSRYMNISNWDESIVPEDYAYKITAGGSSITDVEYQINCLALIRLFGSFEQFEINLLKVLFHYRPNGKSLFDGLEIIDNIDPKIILEEPNIVEQKEIYQYPPLWTWIKPYVNGNDERKKILKNVFGIKIIPHEYGSKTFKSWQEKRNSIAHGKRKEEITLREIFDFSIFCKKLILNAEGICLEKFKLVI